DWLHRCISTTRIVWVNLEVSTQKIGKERLNMKNLLLRLWKNEEGQDLTEYALLLVLLTLAAIGSLSTLATAINGVFSKAVTNLNAT
ncbi:MAG TPA: hypothetical protein VIX19_06695, partial [Terriglobales bacterium]